MSRPIKTRLLEQLRGSRSPNNAETNSNSDRYLSEKRDHSVKEKIKNRNSWLLVFAGIMFTILICTVIFYRFIIKNESANIDTATILTTLLAFFSIYLSATFYFKATEQSNQFYDRSYNHTRDIAKTLSSMEGRFGEGLKNIEQYSTRLNDRFDNLPFINNSLQENVIGETQKNIQELLKAMEGGSISPDEMKKYEERFSQIENENKDLKKKIKGNKQDWSSSDRINFFFRNLIKEYDSNHLLGLSMKELSGVVKGEALKYSDDKFLFELNTHGIVDGNLNLTIEGKSELEGYMKSYNN